MNLSNEQKQEIKDLGLEKVQLKLIDAMEASVMRGDAKCHHDMAVGMLLLLRGLDIIDYELYSELYQRVSFENFNEDSLRSWG